MGDRVPKEVKEKLLASSALGRSAEPEEIADAVSFLISDQARYITGATLDVNGGI
jgi:3-oxoacyl-[acyl-carrier protein] reductase